jgi:putative sigma-54 modulation protein
MIKMHLDIHGDKIIITDSIRNYILSKLSKLDKYFEKPDNIKGRVLIKVKNYEQTVEVTIPIKALTLRTEVSHADLYAAIDLALEKLERQIRKNKTKINSKNEKTIFKTLDISYEDDKEENGQIVKRKKIEMKPMDETEAILQMNLLDHDFFVYKDRKTNRICVLYKRKDKDYGIIETV